MDLGHAVLDRDGVGDHHRAWSARSPRSVRPRAAGRSRRTRSRSPRRSGRSRPGPAGPQCGTRPAHGAGVQRPRGLHDAGGPVPVGGALAGRRLHQRAGDDGLRRDPAPGPAVRRGERGPPDVLLAPSCGTPRPWRDRQLAGHADRQRARVGGRPSIITLASRPPARRPPPHRSAAGRTAPASTCGRRRAPRSCPPAEAVGSGAGDADPGTPGASNVLATSTATAPTASSEPADAPGGASPWRRASATAATPRSATAAAVSIGGPRTAAVQRISRSAAVARRRARRGCRPGCRLRPVRPRSPAPAICLGEYSSRFIVADAPAAP